MRLVRRDVTRYLDWNDHITYRLRRHAYLYTDRYSGAESCILCSRSGSWMGFTWSKFTLYRVGSKKVAPFSFCTCLCDILSGISMYRVFNFKVDRILIWVVYLLRFTTCYITQLNCVYSKCWKWYPFILMHLSTRFAMFLANFLGVLSFTSLIIIFAIALFTGACLLNFSKKHCLQWT